MYYYGKPKHDTLIDILDNFRPTEFNSDETSTILLIDYCRLQDSQNWQPLKNKLKLTELPENKCFEYPTKSYGRNMASYTDLMLIGNTVKVAIEAKYSETPAMYPVIKKWYDNSENRKNVLKHWLKIINPFLKHPRSINDIFEANYQILHRTASSCFDSQKAVVLYILFYSAKHNNTQEFEKEIRKFVELIEPNKDKLSFFLQKVNAEKTKETIIEDIIYELKENQIYNMDVNTDITEI